MRFTKEKKEIILSYLLEKIGEGRENVASLVAGEFDLNLNTVHTYIRELIDEGKIRREKRGQYALCRDEYHFTFSRAEGALEDESFIYEKTVEPLVAQFTDNVRNIWIYCITEMINNVIDHSEAEHVDVTVYQNVEETAVMLRDDGIGIFRKIREYFNLRTDEDVLTELSKGKLTTDQVHHSGEGIFFSSRLMDQFFIYSGNCYFTRDKYRNEWAAIVPEGEMSGTLVYLSLSNNSRRSERDVFNFYTDEDGGFSKTEIRLAAVFDKAPVSRSQAKRLCNRLQEFEEVILDFSDIEWMGQGFAHQLFSVFAKENPEIRLVPQNMSEDVRKMYRHVTA